MSASVMTTRDLIVQRALHALDRWIAEQPEDDQVTLRASRWRAVRDIERDATRVAVLLDMPEQLPH